MLATANRYKPQCGVSPASWITRLRTSGQFASCAPTCAWRYKATHITECNGDHAMYCLIAGDSVRNHEEYIETAFQNGSAESGLDMGTNRPSVKTDHGLASRCCKVEPSNLSLSDVSPHMPQLGQLGGSLGVRLRMSLNKHCCIRNYAAHSKIPSWSSQN